MALADTAKLLASLELDNRKFNAGVDKSMGKLGKLGTKSIAVGTAIGVGIERLAEAGVRKLAGAVTGGIDSLAQLETATTQVSGAITQMGIQGAVTSQQVATWANEIEASVGAAFDDKDIVAATANLIRFGKVTPQNLRPAMVVMTDLAAKTGSVESASALLAKALADPAKAAGKLARVGVVLTKDQQKQLLGLVSLTKAENSHYAALLKKDKKAAERYKTSTLANKQIAAQKYLLDQLAKTTKGAAVSSQGTYQRSLSVLKDVVEDAQRALATGLLPVIEEVRDELSKELAKPETLARIKAFGENLAGGLREVVAFVKSIPWDQVGAVVQGAADFGANIARGFLGLPTEVKGLILGLAALNKLSGGAVINVGVDLLKGAGGTLFQQFLGRGSAVNPMFVVPVGGNLGGIAGGVPAAAAGGGATGGLLGKLALVPVIGTVIAEGFNVLESSNREAAAQRARNTKAIIDGLKPQKQGMSPDERQEFNDQQRALDKIRSSAEANRIALVTSQRTGDASIVSAIKGIQRPIITVNVSPSGRTTTTYRTGTTIYRSGSGNAMVGAERGAG